VVSKPSAQEPVQAAVSSDNAAQNNAGKCDGNVYSLASFTFTRPLKLTSSFATAGEL